MLSVCITRWSSVMSLLLVMSTFPPFLLLLPTVQSLVVPFSMRQLLQPSMASNFSLITSRTLGTNGPLSKSDWSSFDGTANCTEFMAQNRPDIISDCDRIFEQWISLVNKTGGSEAKYTCVKKSIETYWLNTMACVECSAEQYEPYRDSLKPAVASSCAEWPDWIPPLECHKEMLANLSSANYSCKDSVEGDFLKCTEEATLAIAADHIKDPAEELCKIWYANETCKVKVDCEQCAAHDLVNKGLNVLAKVWFPAKVECTKWSSYAPKLECPFSYNTILIVGIILAVIVILVAIGVAVYCMYFSSGGSRGGSIKPSSPNSGKAGSAVGAQKSSRA